MLALPCATAFGQSKNEAAFPWEGEVSGANVFVRSGAGNNWYPTAKLNHGDRVLVMGEKFGWYQIAPPAGSFSYIDISMVDRKGGAKSGTVKQDKVYVRAGSKLEGRKNSMQVVLDKGATVEIIGEADGFFQIKPPNGATLFISKQYVKPVEAAMRTGLVERHVSNPEPVALQAETVLKTDNPAASNSPPSANPSAATDAGRIQIPVDTTPAPAAKEPPKTKPAEPQPSNPVEGVAADMPPGDDIYPPEDKTEESPKASKPKSKASPTKHGEPAAAAPPSTGRYKAMLTLVEGELADMTRKPFDEQDFASLVKKYEPIAQQTEEKVPAQIASIRFRQLNDRAELKLARADNDKDTKALEDLHANMDKERVKIMSRRVDVAMVKYELEGELRESFAFAPENRRYRLVDPASKVTIAYVDIPSTVEGSPQHLIGQLVGIKTSGKKFSPSARVPIAVASEVVDLSPRKALGDAALRQATAPTGAAAKEAVPTAPPVKENLPPPLTDEKSDENTVKIHPPQEPDEPNSDSSPEPAADGGEKAQP